MKHLVKFLWPSLKIWTLKWPVLVKVFQILKSGLDVNNKKVAKGEIVIVDDKIGVTLTEVVINEKDFRWIPEFAKIF